MGVSAPEGMPEAERKIWQQMVDAGSPEGPDLEAFVGQVARLREAQRRIAVEGLVIADPKGFPIPHPAIAIEKSAQEQIRAWGDRFAAPAPRKAGGASW